MPSLRPGGVRTQFPLPISVPAPLSSPPTSAPAPRRLLRPHLLFWRRFFPEMEFDLHGGGFTELLLSMETPVFEAALAGRTDGVLWRCLRIHRSSPQHGDASVREWTFCFSDQIL